MEEDIEILEVKIKRAIQELWENYDAFYISNKYTSIEDLHGNTHEKEFNLLIDKFKNNETAMKAINWILNCYDCYYKNEFCDENSAFAYLTRNLEEI